VLPSEHSPQAPVGWQAGVVPPHSPSAAQARQVCVAVLHTGVVPPHCAFDVHGTQTPAATLQAGVAPMQSVALVAEQTPQAPDVWQAGVEPPQSPSPAHARQVCVAALQIGVAPPHCAFDTHETQTPPAVKQTGVVPPHCALLVAEHWPQAPPG
jgi:hypothetical protein